MLKESKKEKNKRKLELSSWFDIVNAMPVTILTMETLKEGLFLLNAHILSFASDGGKLIYLGIGSQLLDTKKEFSFLIKRHM